jgi:hypothetical protein
MLFPRTLWNFLVRSLLQVMKLFLEMKFITFMLYACMMYNDDKIAFISIRYHRIFDSLSLIRFRFFLFSQMYCVVHAFIFFLFIQMLCYVPLVDVCSPARMLVTEF